MSDDKKDTIITITVGAMAGGKRKLLISGAPEGEMPIVRTGLFGDLHALIDQIWIDLAKRKPEPVKTLAGSKAQAKPKKKKTPRKPTDGPAQVGADEAEEEEQETGESAEEATTEETAPMEAGDQLVASAPPAGKPSETQLPLIENDDTDGPASDEVIAAMKELKTAIHDIPVEKTNG